MDKRKRERLIKLLQPMNREDLAEASTLCQTFRATQDRLHAATFRIGDKVRFYTRRNGGALLHGRVTGRGPKNIMVMADNGRGWRVHPSFLTKTQQRG